METLLEQSKMGDRRVIDRYVWLRRRNSIDKVEHEFSNCAKRMKNKKNVMKKNRNCLAQSYVHANTTLLGGMLLFLL